MAIEININSNLISKITDQSFCEFMYIDIHQPNIHCNNFLFDESDVYSSYSAARYSKINIDIVLSCLNIKDNNRYNIICSFRYNIRIVVSRILSCLVKITTFSNRNYLSK